jgi:hypothetical protein
LITPWKHEERERERERHRKRGEEVEGGLDLRGRGRKILPTLKFPGRARSSFWCEWFGTKVKWWEMKKVKRWKCIFYVMRSGNMLSREFCAFDRRFDSNVLLAELGLYFEVSVERAVCEERSGL